MPGLGSGGVTLAAVVVAVLVVVSELRRSCVAWGRADGPKLVVGMWGLPTHLQPACACCWLLRWLQCSWSYHGGRFGDAFHSHSHDGSWCTGPFNASFITAITSPHCCNPNHLRPQRATNMDGRVAPNCTAPLYCLTVLLLFVLPHFVLPGGAAQGAVRQEAVAGGGGAPGGSGDIK